MTSRPENHPSVSHRIPKRGPGRWRTSRNKYWLYALGSDCDHRAPVGRNWPRADFNEREETNGPCEQDVAGTKQQQQERKKQTNLKSNMRIVQTD